MPVTLTFHGAARTVTGSCYRLEHAGGTVLVDCGLFQGSRTLQELNERPFPFDPRAIDHVLVTHAHTDHAGLLPKLTAAGWNGPILATGPTCDLLRFMLPDSGAIQEADAERASERNRRRGRPAVEPIYTEADAEASLRQLRPVDLDHWVDVQPGLRARWWNAGHVLGSASIEVEARGGDGADPVRILFSGDIGPDEKSFHDDPEGPAGVDHLLVETTYGDRDREDLTLADREARLGREVADALAAGGAILVPAFAVERTQEVLYALGRLIEQGRIPEIPVYIDSPLAHRATEAFTQHAGTFGERDARRILEAPWVRFTSSVEDSKALARVQGRAVIMAASGMCEAGRIRHHLRERLWRPGTTVLFVGYQAGGTLGRILLDGARRVRIFGEEIAVEARIRRLDSFSAHADQAELLRWVTKRLPVRGNVFLTHGEPAAMEGFRTRLVQVGLQAAHILAPTIGQRFGLAPVAATTLEAAAPPLSDAALGWDWHNAYARLLLDLGERLRALPDEASRRALLDRLRADLDLGPGAAPSPGTGAESTGRGDG